MKSTLLILSCCMVLTTGCSSSYVIKLSNGTRVMTSSKPKPQSAFLVFKDAQGREAYVPQGRVREVLPASQAAKEKSPFIQK